MKSSGPEDLELELTPFFLHGAAGRIFCLYVGPAPGAPRRGGVLFVPPFAEETNKSRRQVMLQARALAAAGHGVLLVDLFGTGDSEGDFAQGRWEIWRGDLVAALRWLEARQLSPVVLWGLRWGALLAAELAHEVREQLPRLLFWQPVLDGRQYNDQFIRMRVASSMLTGRTRITVQDLRGSLKRGETVEVAGYLLQPDLVAAIDGRSLVASRLPHGCLVDWIEVVGDSDAGMSVGSQRVIAAWQDTGAVVRSSTVVGQQFWATTEIAVVPALIERTTQALAAPACKP
jgi:exosortase A-associated hydrolase 2